MGRRVLQTTKKNTKPKKYLRKIIRKHNFTELEKTIFTNYVNYMNDESKSTFLKRAYKSDRDYIDQFIDTDLENFGAEQFGEIDYNQTRKQNVEMYSMLEEKNDNNILLVYKGFLNKLVDVPKEIKREIYKDKLKINIEKYNSSNIIEKRTLVYTKFVRYLSKLERSQLEKFIDDVFDKTISIERLF